MKDRNTKVITIAALVIAVIALSIGFAAFASTLTINTSARVTPTDTFSVKFASRVTGSNNSFTDFDVTPDVAVTSTADNGAVAGTPEINNSNVKNPTIGNLTAAFTQPGQSVTYTFYVVNDGNYDAYLTNVVFNNASNHDSFRKCLSNASSDNPATQSLVDSVCNNITFTMSIGNASGIVESQTLTNHLLLKNHYEEVTVTIAYTGSAYADGAFTVSFGDIGLNYSTIDEPNSLATSEATYEKFEIVSQNKTVNTLSLNDEIRLGNEYFNYLTSSGDTITMFAKYNLNVGNHPYGGVATNLQEPNAIGANSDLRNSYGGVLFHSTSDIPLSEMTEVSNLSNYTIYQYLENYKDILEDITGISDIQVTLPGFELFTTGLCSMDTKICNLAYDTSFWSKIATTNDSIGVYAFDVGNLKYSFNTLYPSLYNLPYDLVDTAIGVRPVIIVPTSSFY